MDCQWLWDLYYQLQNMYWEFLWVGDWESLTVVIWAMLQTASAIGQYGC